MSQDIPITSDFFLNIDAGGDMDADQLDRLTRQLRNELLELDTESVDLVKSEDTPEGTKSAEAVTAGALAVAVLPSFLPKLLEYLQSWTMRGEERKVKVKSQIGDRSIELEYSPNALSQEELKELVTTLTETLAEDPKPE
jgi:hypothetical protein